MKKIIVICFAILSVSVSAQEQILQEIEKNNTLLVSLRSQAEAEKIGNKTGIFLENPEIEYSYLWGEKGERENKRDFSISQSFDFPSAYYHRKKLSDNQNVQVGLKYRIERKDILLEAKNICIQLIYQNVLSKELKKQLDLSRQLFDAYSKKMEVGEASILEVNKVNYAYLNAKKEYDASVIDQEFLQAELQRLNGGNSIGYLGELFPEANLPLNFENWYEDQLNKNLDLLSVKQEMAANKENEKLQRSLNLPKFSAGYLNAHEEGIRFNGFSVGVSIPLWENKNTVKQIKAQAQADEQREVDITIQYFHQMEALYKKAIKLKETLNELNRFELSDNTLALLGKALDKGEISLIEFTLELDVYYELIQNRLEIEKDLHLTLAELMKWNL